jgi:hypothetical protein
MSGQMCAVNTRSVRPFLARSANLLSLLSRALARMLGSSLRRKFKNQSPARPAIDEPYGAFRSFI